MKREVKVALIVLTVIFLISLGFIGCTKTPTSTKVWTLKFGMGTSESAWYYDASFGCFKRNVEERSGGRIKIELYPSGSLVGSKDLVAGIQNGLIDIGAMHPNSYYSAEFPLETVTGVPGLVSLDPMEFGDYMNNVLYDKYWKKHNEEDIGFHNLGINISTPYWIFSKSKPLNNVEDCAGFSIRSGTKQQNVVWERLGMVSVAVGVYDAYEALQKGTLDGSAHGPAIIKGYKWYETGKPGYIIDFIDGMYGGMVYNNMSKKVYDSMPRDLQKILDEEGYNCLTKGYIQSFMDYEESAIKEMTEAGITIIKWTPSERAKAADLAVDAIDEWIDSMEAQGLPGQALVDDMRKESAKSKYN